MVSPPPTDLKLSRQLCQASLQFTANVYELAPTPNFSANAYSGQGPYMFWCSHVCSLMHEIFSSCDYILVPLPYLVYKLGFQLVIVTRWFVLAFMMVPIRSIILVIR